MRVATSQICDDSLVSCHRMQLILVPLYLDTQVLCSRLGHHDAEAFTTM